MRKVLQILGGLDDADLQWLLDAGARHAVAGGTPIIRQGAAQDCLYIIANGEFVVMRSGAELARLGCGEVVGEMSLLDSRPPTATVTALHDGVVFAIPQAVLRAKLGSDAAFAARFYRALGIVLANRLSAMAAGAAGSTPDTREISPELLDSVALAGARFDWFLSRLREG